MYRLTWTLLEKPAKIRGHPLTAHAHESDREIGEFFDLFSNEAHTEALEEPHFDMPLLRKID